ncbi:MAG: DUF2806 domain-containing protein [Chloroflexi bacterium]|nr:DUF2806 domain-containing protein [Chloroflexota bacterium]MYF23032.1 DUF2806 domain-containing protein [Chloroflexota bacterium]
MEELADLLGTTEDSLSLTGRGWSLGKLALPRLGTFRKATGDSELGFSITAPDGTSWQFVARGSDEQVRNALAIAKEAFENLAYEVFSTEDVDEEWQDRFWDDAKRKYTQEARSVYAKILAGELRQPGSISKMTLSVLDDLDQRTAEIFQRYCTLAARFSRITAVMYEPPDLDWADNGLAEFGVDYEDIGRLAEHGLIRDASSQMEATLYIDRTEDIPNAVTLQFMIAGTAYNLKAVPGKDYTHMQIVLATATGNELARFVEPSPDVDVHAYTSKLFGEMEKKGARVVQVNHI